MSPLRTWSCTKLPGLLDDRYCAMGWPPGEHGRPHDACTGHLRAPTLVSDASRHVDLNGITNTTTRLRMSPSVRADGGREEYCRARFYSSAPSGACDGDGSPPAMIYLACAARLATSSPWWRRPAITKAAFPYTIPAGHCLRDALESTRAAVSTGGDRRIPRRNLSPRVQRLLPRHLGPTEQLFIVPGGLPITARVTGDPLTVLHTVVSDWPPT